MKEFTENLTAPDGSMRECWVFKFPISDSNGKKMVGGIALDVTERRQLEERLRHTQKMKTVGQLAAGIAHEFNNILTIIIGSAEEIPYEEGAGPRVRGLSRNITAAAERAAGLVRQLITFGQKNAARIQRLDCNELVGEASAIIRPLLGGSTAFEFIPGASLPQIEADRDLIQQMLLSLAINAREAMQNSPERRLTISTTSVEVEESALRTSVDARPGPAVVITMRDTGHGMDEETLAHLFEPFYSTKDVGEGTGLGLATVYGIVHRHKGWIEVETSVGRGTAFHIFLPAAPPLSERRKKALAPAANGGRETILLVEDEIVVRRVIREGLAHYGYRIIEADSGLQALPIWEIHKNEVSLLITDMVMPDGMTGSDLSRELRKDKPGLKVIHMTGYSEEIAGMEIAEKKGTRFLQKPFSPQQIAACIRELLDEPA
jgi:signal transduction histidine kinase/ActR/RegA family two-component response regulator